jgi:hypothetical protein
MARTDWKRRAWNWSATTAALALMMERAIWEARRGNANRVATPIEMIQRLEVECRAQAVDELNRGHMVRHDWWTAVAERYGWALRGDEPQPTNASEEERGQCHFGTQ